MTHCGSLYVMMDHMSTTSRHAVPALLDWDAAAEALNCTPRMVRKLVETRQLESVKVGRLVRFELAAITRYIESRRRPAV